MTNDIIENDPTIFQIDPVEHAVVEAGWGEGLIGDKSELLRCLGAKPLSEFVQSHVVSR